MFAMDLGRYQEIAESIVNNASRELAIERGVQEVAKIWSEMKFQLVTHEKAGEKRGYILGSVEELNQVSKTVYNLDKKNLVPSSINIICQNT